MNLRFWAATDTGRVRDHNEDNFLVDKNLQLFVVCDGMGGHAAGEVASAICVRTVREIIAGQSELLSRLRDDPDDEFAVEKLKLVMQRAVEAGNSRIFEMAQEDPSRRGMGTTCTALVIAGDRGFVGHVGDSRMYRLRQGEIEQVTDDHSLLNEMIRQGQIPPETTEEEFQHQNAVTRAVGVRESVEVDAFSVDIEAGDRLLMCSDGLSEYLGDAVDFGEMMADGEPKDVTGGCIDFANDSGGKDNITVVVVDCDDQPATDTVESESQKSQRDKESEAFAELIHQIPFFQYLSARELEQTLQLSVRIDVDEGDAIISDEEDNDKLFMILEGAVSLSLENEEIGVLKSGDHFGEMAVIDAQDERETNMIAEAVESSTLLAIERDNFVGLFQEAPSLALKLLWNFVQVFAERLRRVRPEIRYALGEVRAEPESISDVTGETIVSEDELARAADEKSAAGTELSDSSKTEDDQEGAEQTQETPQEKTDKVVIDDSVDDEEKIPAVSAGGDLRAAMEDEDDNGKAEPDAVADGSGDDKELELNDDEMEDLRETIGLDDEFDSHKLVAESQKPGDEDAVEAETTDETSDETAIDEQPEGGGVQINRPGGGASDNSAPAGDEAQKETVELDAPRELAGLESQQDEDEGEDLRSTVQLDWSDAPEELTDSVLEEQTADDELDDGPVDDESAAGTAKTAQMYAVESDDGDDDTEGDEGESGKALRDKLRARLKDSSAPAAGILRKQNDEPESSSASSSPGEDGQGPSDEPKVMVSSDLMGESDEE